MAGGAGIGLQAERRVSLPCQPGLRREPPAKDALYRETLQTTGRTTRILNRPKRVCVDRQPAHPVTRAVARRECALPAEPRALNLAFLRHDGIYRSDVVSKQNHQNLRAGCRLPLVGPRASVQGRDKRSASCSSSAMSSGRLFLDRVARQQSPSPLHRHPQINTHSRQAEARGDISTLPGRGRFYFATTLFPCSLDTAHSLRYTHRPGFTPDYPV